MVEGNEFNQILQKALTDKQAWYNTVQLQELLSQYRLLHICVKNIYDFLVKKSSIVPDPYRLDQKISEIVIPPTEPFAETDIPQVLGSRFSDYENMLDFICTYYRFSIENMTLGSIKKLSEFNKVFAWDNLVVNNAHMNTRALANVIASSKNNAPGVILSMLSDSCEKCSKAVVSIDKGLNELALFQKELYKGEVRKQVFEHPDFNKEKAFSSQEEEFNEIKRLFPKVIGKTMPFYASLVNEIVAEDQADNREKLRADVLRRLEITESVKTVTKKKGPEPKELLMAAVFALGAFAPTLTQLNGKVTDNFNVYYEKKKTLMTKLGEVFKKAFKIKEKEKICVVPITDAKTGLVRSHKIEVKNFMEDMYRKEKIYGAIASKGVEYTKINSSSEDAIIQFLNKQISEVQTLFMVLNGLDAMFKNDIDVLKRAKVKGLQIELSAMRNTIVNVNKKRGEYVSVKEESEQMKRLGLAQNA